MQYEDGSAPALALDATIERTNKRFDNYAKSGVLCGSEGLPHLISDPGFALRYGHAGEVFVRPCCLTCVNVLPTTCWLLVAALLASGAALCCHEQTSSNCGAPVAMNQYVKVCPGHFGRLFKRLFAAGLAARRVRK